MFGAGRDPGRVRDICGRQGPQDPVLASDGLDAVRRRRGRRPENQSASAAVEGNDGVLGSAAEEFGGDDTPGPPGRRLIKP